MPTKARDLGLLMPLYYHGSPHAFPVGHVITAGGHGRRYRSFMLPEHTHLFENACEDIRARYFPQKPSRFACIFACENEQALALFCTKFANREHYYEVEAVDPSVPLHRGTWNLVYGAYLHGMVNCSWAYWTQAPQDCVEVVIGGDVRVVRKIQ